MEIITIREMIVFEALATLILIPTLCFIEESLAIIS